MNRELRQAINWSFWIPIAVIAALIVGAVMHYAVLPTLYNQETKAVRNSNQYITSQQELMLRLVDEYYQLDSEILELQSQEGKENLIEGKQNQQAALIARIQSASTKIKSEYIPETVQEFLREVE